MSKSPPSVLEVEVDAADAELFVEATLALLLADDTALLDAVSFFAPQAVSETTIASDKIPANNFFFINFSFYIAFL